jgi:hypothetical protein
MRNVSCATVTLAASFPTVTLAVMAASFPIGFFFQCSPCKLILCCKLTCLVAVVNGLFLLLRGCSVQADLSTFLVAWLYVAGSFFPTHFFARFFICSPGAK